jgi:hypothetical protein
MDNYSLYNSYQYNIWSSIFFDKIIKYNINNKFLSSNKNINENTVIKNLNFNWNLVYLSRNPSISFHFLEYLIRMDKIEYSESDLDCYYNNICKNPTYTIKNALNEKKNINNLYTYSLNTSIKWDDIINNMDFNWNFRYLSKNRNISFQNIIDNLHFDWNYNEIIKNPIFNIKDIYKLPKLKKYASEYYENPNFDFNEYISFFEINHCSQINRSIYRNENISIKIMNDIVKLFPEFNIEYDLLSDKKNIDFDFIFSNNYNWDIFYLSQNPNLTFNIIDNYDYRWEYQYMAYNTFDKQREITLSNIIV